MSNYLKSPLRKPQLSRTSLELSRRVIYDSLTHDRPSLWEDDVIPEPQSFDFDTSLARDVDSVRTQRAMHEYFLLSEEVKNSEAAPIDAFHSSLIRAKALIESGEKEAGLLLLKQCFLVIGSVSDDDTSALIDEGLSLLQGVPLEHPTKPNVVELVELAIDMEASLQ